jgi:hemoglobin-like flavoprotein
MSINTALLQSSFLKIIPRQQTFTATFYDTLFTEHQELKALFAYTDMHIQQNKLFATLSATIIHLDNPAVLVSSLHELGRRHVDYYVKPEYYTFVKDALLKTFATVLGDDWNEELYDIWSEGFDAIASLMQDVSTISTQ